MSQERLMSLLTKTGYHCIPLGSSPSGDLSISVYENASITDLIHSFCINFINGSWYFLPGVESTIDLKKSDQDILTDIKRYMAKVEQRGNWPSTKINNPLIFKLPHNLYFKDGDILEVKDQYIAQQCNCMTRNYKGLSKAIVEKFPWATFYESSIRTPGTITVLGDEKYNQRKVIGMYAQRHPGSPKFSNDTEVMRMQWFQECLNRIAKIPDIKEVGFPYNIGCGLAGGCWNIYRPMIEKFAEKNAHINVTIYRNEKCS